MALTACFWVHKEGACSEFQWKGKENTVKSKGARKTARGEFSVHSVSDSATYLSRYMIIIAT